ncbi:MAG TPA: DNA mismatch repair protein MutL, partial [Herpetosiphonaceae bacterium]
AADGAPGMPQPGEARLPLLRVVGQVANTYIIAEAADGMYLIDQHAAHERVVYERLMRDRMEQPIDCQPLLMAQAVELPPALARLLAGHLAELRDWGFELEEFGEGTLMARAVPAGLEAGQIAPALLEIADHLSGAGGSTPEDWREAMLTTVACHSAIRAGKVLAHEEMRQLLQQLERCELPRTCPHGRPTMLQLSQGQIERQFGRKG